MPDTVYQTNETRSENLRLIMQISYERCNQLKNINNQLLAIIAAIFLGLFTIAFNFFTTSTPANNYLIIVAVHVLIVTLIIWRYYVHLIDNELVSCYKRILYCEEKLDIPFEISLASWLEKNIEFELSPPHKNSVELSRKKKYIEQTNTKKNQIIQKLIESNKSGYRFHNIWDKVVGFSVFIILLYQLIYLLSNFSQFLDIYWSVAVFMPIGYGLALWALTKDLKNNISIQRDPKNAELEKIIDDINNSN